MLAPFAPLIQPVVQALPSPVRRVLVRGALHAIHQGVDQVNREVSLRTDPARAMLGR